MMDLIFYSNNESYLVESVSDETYEKLAKAGLSKVVKYSNIALKIEDDEYDVTATCLDNNNRNILIQLVSELIFIELDAMCNNLDDNPTIKEIRESTLCMKDLNTLLKLLKSEEYIYFSFD